MKLATLMAVAGVIAAGGIPSPRDAKDPYPRSNGEPSRDPRRGCRLAACRTLVVCLCDCRVCRIACASRRRDAEAHAARLTQAVKRATLECDHCGDVALESATGLFGEDDGGACMSCGMPGNVVVDDTDEESVRAYWSTRDDSDHFCKRPECDECSELRRVSRNG